MPFNWENYIDFGRELQNSINETDRRTSVSRGYYGAYHKARVKLGVMAESYIRHEDIIKKLRENPNLINGRRLSSILSTLKQNRVDADYKSRIDINLRYTSQFWLRMDQFLECWNLEDDT